MKYYNIIQEGKHIFIKINEFVGLPIYQQKKVVK